MYEHQLANLVNEINPDMMFPEYEAIQPGSELSFFGQQQPQAPAPSQPVAAPQRAPKESVGVEDLLEANKPQEAPEALTNQMGN